MKLKNCSHPNCKVSATKQHPKHKDRKVLCDVHYNEIVSSAKNIDKMVILTCAE